MATITPSVCCRHCWRTCDDASIVRAQRQSMFARPRSLPQRVSSSRVRRSTFGTRADMVRSRAHSHPQRRYCHRLIFLQPRPLGAVTLRMKNTCWPGAPLRVDRCVVRVCLQTTGVLEGVAKLALQSQLRTFRAVDVKVNASPSRLLQGALDGAIVRGIAWESPLGLSARLLEVRVVSVCHSLARLLRYMSLFN
jgi:hypothetical protein